MLDAELAVDVLEKRKGVQLLAGGHIREAHRATVLRAQIVLEQRVFVRMPAPRLVHLRRCLGLHQRDDLCRLGTDVVERDVIGGERASEGLEHPLAQLLDVEQAADVADELQQSPLVFR